MQEALRQILEIQELDMQMIQLMRLKRKIQDELLKCRFHFENLKQKLVEKQADIFNLKKDIKVADSDVLDVTAKIKKLESQQASVKKAEEFNALSHEMSQADRERTLKEAKASDLQDRLIAEEDVLKVLKETLGSSEQAATTQEAEITASIVQINEEGTKLKKVRDELVGQADTEILKIYERLLKNKKDKVVVPIHNRCCTGCHTMLTAQDENMVRKGERLVFCEHCSRIHYWQESEALQGSSVATKQRRRKAPTKA